MNQDSSSKTIKKVLPIDIPKVNIQGVNSPTASSFAKKSALKVDTFSPIISVANNLIRKPSLEIARSPSPTGLYGTTSIPWMQLGEAEKSHNTSYLGVSSPLLMPSRPESPVSPGQVCIYM